TRRRRPSPSRFRYWRRTTLSRGWRSRGGGRVAAGTTGRNRWRWSQDQGYRLQGGCGTAATAVSGGAGDALFTPGAGTGYPAGMSLVELSERPELRNPFLVVHLTGWTDAGMAGQTSAVFLRARWNARRLAEFDSDELIDYRARRPGGPPPAWPARPARCSSGHAGMPAGWPSSTATS